MTLPERLKELRKEKHMTQAQLANILGVAKGTVAMWEMGKRNPSLATLEQMSAVFERTVSYIMGTSDDPSSQELSESAIQQLGAWAVEEDYMEVLMKYLRLDGRGKAAVEALINAEFNLCKAENTLHSRDNFQLTVRVKPE